jgi:uncharacterized membrane protein
MMQKSTATVLFLAASAGHSLAFHSSAQSHRQVLNRQLGATILPPSFHSHQQHSKTLFLSSSSTTSLGLSWPSFVGGRSTQSENGDLSVSFTSTASNKQFSKRKIVSTLARRTAIAFVALTLFQAGPALAAKKAAKDATEHLHTGQKIAKFFMGFGLPKLAVLATISAMPVVELRGAIPVGVWMGLPIWQVFLTCVVGNMIPIIPLLFLLKNDTLKKLMSPILKRAEKKASGLGVGSIEKQWVSLAAFVGIPLPGTGAWTGTIKKDSRTSLMNIVCVLMRRLLSF